MLVESVLLLIIGFGLGAYHRWAWYGAVVILLPMTIGVSLASIFAAALDPIYLFVVCLWPIFCGYVAWVPDVKRRPAALLRELRRHGPRQARP
ncbi:MAG: hypothetical protein IID44_06295 [Planctomycetes bacterium]|nr:hypothetical protein [Planctomycetota bacterium]